MAGKIGQKGWNKREELEWRDLWNLSKAELVKLGKKYKAQSIKEINSKDRLYQKWLDISATIFIKGMPQKIEASGIGEINHYHITIVRSAERVAQDITPQLQAR